MTLTAANLSLPRSAQRPGEVLVDLGMEQTRGRDWTVTRVPVRSLRRLGRRTNVHVVDWPTCCRSLPEDEQTDVLMQLDTERAADVLEAMEPDPTGYLARELAALRIAVGDVATRDHLRRELEHADRRSKKFS